MPSKTSVLDKDAFDLAIPLSFDPCYNVRDISFDCGDTETKTHEIRTQMRLRMSAPNALDMELYEARLAKDGSGILVEEPLLPSHHRDPKRIGLYSKVAAIVKGELENINLRNDGSVKAQEVNSMTKKTKTTLMGSLPTTEPSMTIPTLHQMIRHWSAGP